MHTHRWFETPRQFFFFRILATHSRGVWREYTGNWFILLINLCRLTWKWTIFAVVVPSSPCFPKFEHNRILNQGRPYLYRVFRLDSTPFIPLVEQHKLDSCSMCCLSKTLQGLCCGYLNFLFSKSLEQFFKNSSLRAKNDRNVQLTPKCGKCNVVFLVKKIGA